MTRKMEKAGRRRGLDPAGRVKVLVVEDDRNQRQLAKIVLATEGFVVETAANGREALGKVRYFDPAVVVTDVMMPDMDGFELCRRLRADPGTAAIPLLFVTARVEVKDRLEGFSLGADDYLGKPYTPDELIHRVRSVLRRSRYLEQSVGAPVFSPKEVAVERERDSDGSLLLEEATKTKAGVLLAGKLSTATVVEVLQALGLKHMTGTMRVHGSGRGLIEMRKGELVHAEVLTPLRRITGLKAWFRLAGWIEGVFELRELRPRKTERASTLDLPLQNLLMEAVVYRDEIERVIGLFPTMDLMLMRRGSLPFEATDLQQTIWASIGRGIEIIPLLDKLDETDLEILKCTLKLLRKNLLLGLLPGMKPSDDLRPADLAPPGGDED